MAACGWLIKNFNVLLIPKVAVDVCSWAAGFECGSLDPFTRVRNLRLKGALFDVFVPFCLSFEPNLASVKIGKSAVHLFLWRFLSYTRNIPMLSLYI